MYRASREQFTTACHSKMHHETSWIQLCSQHKMTPRSLKRYAALAILVVIMLLYHSSLPRVGVLKTVALVQNSAEPLQATIPTTSKRAMVGKTTVLYGDTKDGMYDRVLHGHERHATAQGHEMIVLRQKLLHGLWSKVGYILSTLLKELERPKNERLQWLFWFDMDIVLLNSRIPLDIFLPPADFSDVHLIVTNDHNGLNSGAFFVRVSEWSVQFFLDVMALPNYRPDVPLKYNDQSAMEFVLKQNRYRNQTMFVPQRWFNAYRGPRDDKEELIKGRKVPENTITRGDLQVHFAGKETTGIKTYIPFWLNVSESRQWEVPVQETQYRREIQDFWNLKRREAAKAASLTTKT